MSHYESNIYYAQKTVFCNHTNGVHRMRWEWINTKYHTMINKVERKIGFWRNSIFIVQFGDCFSCHSCHVTRPRNIPHCLYFKNKLNIDITSKYYKIRIQYGVQIHKIEAEVLYSLWAEQLMLIYFESARRRIILLAEGIFPRFHFSIIYRFLPHSLTSLVFVVYHFLWCTHYWQTEWKRVTLAIAIASEH